MFKKVPAGKNSTGLRQHRFEEVGNQDVTLRKVRIRAGVEEIATGDNQPYDKDDQIADNNNALRALITACAASGVDITDPAITKFTGRQDDDIAPIVAANP